MERYNHYTPAKSNPMKKISVYSIDANENSKKYENINLSEAIKLLKSFPWEDELVRAEETGCYATVSFGASPLNSHSEYVNISSLESNKYNVIIEAFSKRTLLGFIPKWKSAFLDINAAPEITVEEFIIQLYKLPQNELYNWILEYKKSKNHRPK